MKARCTSLILLQRPSPVQIRSFCFLSALLPLPAISPLIISSPPRSVCVPLSVAHPFFSIRRSLRRRKGADSATSQKSPDKTETRQQHPQTPDHRCNISESAVGSGSLPRLSAAPRKSIQLIILESSVSQKHKPRASLDCFRLWDTLLKVF